MDIEQGKTRLWVHRTGALELGQRTRIMGVVNVTPDSFSDGGKFLDPAAAAEHALRLQEDGADLLDFGAESTRPGSEPVSAAEQLRRLLPVLSRLEKHVHLPVSVDTSSAEVARECLCAGASIINDVSAFRRDARMPQVCAEFEAGVVLMHMRGEPRTMQNDTHYDDLLGEVRAALVDAVRKAQEAGMNTERLVVDPGIGFGKSFEQNYLLLGNMRFFRGLGAGVMAGPSRKAFTGEFSKLPPAQRQFSTAAAVALAVWHGADIVRVHDVREMRQVTDIVDRFRAVYGANTSHYSAATERGASC